MCKAREREARSLSTPRSGRNGRMTMTKPYCRRPTRMSRAWRGTRPTTTRDARCPETRADALMGYLSGWSDPVNVAVVGSHRRRCEVACPSRRTPATRYRVTTTPSAVQGARQSSGRACTSTRCLTLKSVRMGSFIVHEFHSATPPSDQGSPHSARRVAEPPGPTLAHNDLPTSQIRLVHPPLARSLRDTHGSPGHSWGLRHRRHDVGSRHATVLHESRRRRTDAVSASSRRPTNLRACSSAGRRPLLRAAPKAPVGAALGRPTFSRRFS